MKASFYRMLPLATTLALLAPHLSSGRAAPPAPPNRQCHLPIPSGSAVNTSALQQAGRIGQLPINGILPTTKTVMVPMRDGVRLHTVVATPPLSRGPYPVVIDRSPYGEFGTELLADIFLLFGFAAVSQDMRGSCKSEGNFSMFRTDTADGADTVAWIAQQDWSDGRVYQIGGSADGIVSLELALAHPPSLQSQFIIFATAEARRTFLPGGAYRQALVEKWLYGTVPDQAAGCVQQLKQHESPDDWWAPLEFNTSSFAQVTWPTVMWGGWYDIFIHGNLYAFKGFQKLSDPTVRGKHYLVIDPLGHCQGGMFAFPKNLIAGRSLLPILLGATVITKGAAVVPKGIQAVTFYVMGSMDAPKGIGNYWTSLPDWPAPTYTPYYLQANGTLSVRAPSSSAATATAAAAAAAAADVPTTYFYDPKDPTPGYGGNNLMIACGPKDQSATLKGRTDLATFTTEALIEPVAVTGSLEAELYVSSANVNDTDFAVKLIDVYPGKGKDKDGEGKAILIQDGIQRMRWRDSPQQAAPKPMVPGEVYKISVSLWNTSYVFPKGHRIRVVVSSANHPRFEPNPNTGLPLGAEGSRTIVAENSVYHDAGRPSSIMLPVVRLSQLPEHSILESVAQTAEALGGGPAVLAAAQRSLDRISGVLEAITGESAMEQQ